MTWATSRLQGTEVKCVVRIKSKGFYAGLTIIQLKYNYINFYKPLNSCKQTECIDQGKQYVFYYMKLWEVTFFTSINRLKFKCLF